MIAFWQVVAILIQSLLLWGVTYFASAGGKSVFQRYLNPGCWFAFFFTLWFLIPQVISLTNSNFVLDFPGATPAIVLRSQWLLVMFVSLVLTGLIITSSYLSRWGEIRPQVHYQDLTTVDRQLMWALYACGVAATLLLGNRLMDSDEMRSELVKTPSGLIATIVGFFGLYAMAVLIGHGLYQRKYIRTFLVVLFLGGAIFFTGARGRLLWPIVLGVSYYSCRTNRVHIKPLIGIVLIGLTVLLVFDPVLIALRGGNLSMKEVREKVAVSNLFMQKRNFDGFANFTLINTSDSLPADPNIVLTGARETFMNHYYPEVFEKGVGFGTTFPGMLWLAGGMTGLAIGASLYGVMLALLAAFVKRIRHEPMFWSYLFAMTWLAAIGGNFQESLDKMMIIAAPGFLWKILSAYCQPTKEQEPDWTPPAASTETGSES